MTTLTETFDRIDRLAPNAGLYLTRTTDSVTTAYFGTDNFTIGVEPLAADLPGDNSHLVTLVHIMWLVARAVAESEA